MHQSIIGYHPLWAYPRGYSLLQCEQQLGLMPHSNDRETSLYSVLAKVTCFNDFGQELA